jgi:parallel beta-helix repeat protein
VTAQEGSQPQGLSDESFQIADGGTDYYVNDASLTGDEFTTATGDNVHDGKSPSQPMATLAALLTAYDLGPGDVVHVDAGTYQLLRSAVIAADDAGVRIEGPSSAVALLNRGNTFAGSYPIELVNADGVTIERLSVSGGQYGIFADLGSDSDNLTLRHMVAFGNASSGVRLESGNEHATIADSTFHSQPHYGLYVDGNDALVTGNTAFSNGNSFFTQGIGISVRGSRSLVENNEAHSNWDGINATSFSTDPAQRVVVRGNRVHDNSVNGIETLGAVLVANNEVFGQRSGEGSNFPGTGLKISSSGGEALGNTVYDNLVGIDAATATVRGNRVFHNIKAGINASNSRVEGNQVYANAAGIVLDVSNGSLLANNLVYANSDRGLVVTATSGNPLEVANNTVYQPAGQALRLESGSRSVSLHNNILWTEAGYAVFVNGTATGFSSDYNLLLTGADPSAHVGFWNNANQHSLANWQTASLQDALHSPTIRTLSISTGPTTSSVTPPPAADETAGATTTSTSRRTRQRSIVATPGRH